MSILDFGVFCVFFINTRNTNTRRPSQARLLNLQRDAKEPGVHIGWK
jgi:hypothetical protein